MRYGKEEKVEVLVNDIEYYINSILRHKQIVEDAQENGFSQSRMADIDTNFAKIKHAKFMMKQSILRILER